MQTVSIIREKFMKKIIVTFIATITAALLLCFSVSAFDNNDYGVAAVTTTEATMAADMTTAVTITAAAATAAMSTPFLL